MSERGIARERTHTERVRARERTSHGSASVTVLFSCVRSVGKLQFDYSGRSPLELRHCSPHLCVCMCVCVFRPFNCCCWKDFLSLFSFIHSFCCCCCIRKGASRCQPSAANLANLFVYCLLLSLLLCVCVLESCLSSSSDGG